MSSRIVSLLVSLVLAADVGRAAENPFTNATGVTSADLTPAAEDFFGYENSAGMTYSPTGSGQMVLGPYYDVRTVRDPNGAVDVQQTLITIRNTNPADPADPNYDPNGGVLFRFGLRESKYGVLATTFPIVLGCGQAWRATVFRGAEGLPRIRSDDPIVTVSMTTFDQIVTEPALATPDGEELQILEIVDSIIDTGDLQRGGIEVVAIESTRCQPDDPPVSASGNTWTRPDIEGSRGFVATNALSGSVDVVRVLDDRVRSYDMARVARHRPGSAGFLMTSAIPFSAIFGNETPNIDNCLGFEQLSTFPYTGLPKCGRQFNFAMSRARLRARFRVSDESKPTLLAINLLRTRNCNLSPSGALFKTYPQTSFACTARGERVGVTVYSDLGEIVSRKTIRLRRSFSIVSVGRADPVADVVVKTKGLDSGTVELDFARDRKGRMLHQERVPTDYVDFLSAGYKGYEGLPVVAVQLAPDGASPSEGSAGWFEPSFDVGYLPE